MELFIGAVQKRRGNWGCPTLAFLKFVSGKGSQLKDIFLLINFKSNQNEQYKKLGN